MKVTLANPAYTFWQADKQYLSRALGHSPPLGLLSLAAYVRSSTSDIEVSVVDAPAEGISNDQLASRLIASCPQVIGITVTTMVAPSVQRVAKLVKKALPTVTVIVGGPHISSAGVEAMQACKDLDFGVCGEGEVTFLELLQALRSGRSAREIPGVIWRDAQDSLHQNEPRTTVVDLDRLPQPAWDLLDGFPARYPTNVFFSPGGPATSLVTSRGCSFRCAFCDQSTFGHRYRSASAETVLRAVERVQKDYGIRYITFYDDTFTLDRQRVLDLCGLLRGLKRRIAWSCDANVMTMDRTLIEKMKRAGCWSVSYGLESGSPEVLASLRKQIDLGRAREVIEDTRAVGVHAKGLFIMGVPEESMETIRLTREFIRSVPLSTINLSKFTPYPGSELHSRVGVQLDGDYGRMNGMHFVLPSKYLSIEELEREYERTIEGVFGTRRSRCLHLSILFGRWDHLRRCLEIMPDLLKAKLRRGRSSRET